MNGWLNVKDRQMDGCWMDEWMVKYSGWMFGQMNGWMNEWMIICKG